jgi:peptide/nickel transport system substrate-binding protein
VPELQDLRSGQAIAHAIDKGRRGQPVGSEGSQVAVTFQPETVVGYTEDVTTYEYDPEKARALLEEAGKVGLTLEVQLPDRRLAGRTMPSARWTPSSHPVAVEAVASRHPRRRPVEPRLPRQGHGQPDHGIHLLGWTVTTTTPDNFLGVFFGQKTQEWGFDNPELFSALTEARGLPTRDEQTPVYEEINKQVMEFLPGVPIAHPVPSLAFAPEVKGYQPSPVQDEVWNTVTGREK